MLGTGDSARSVEITSLGDGKEPRVVSRNYGQCGGKPDVATPGSVVRASQAPAPA
jgi:hypothetical protein